MGVRIERRRGTLAQRANVNEEYVGGGSVRINQIGVSRFTLCT